jgi:hypothetical protein
MWSKNYTTRLMTPAAYAASTIVNKPLLAPSLVYHVYKGTRDLPDGPVFDSRRVIPALRRKHHYRLLYDRRLNTLTWMTPTAALRPPKARNTA